MFLRKNGRHLKLQSKLCLSCTVRYVNHVNLQYEMCNVTNGEWREIWICNMNLYLVRIEFSWRSKRLGVIERSRCIDYFIELPAEITHPRRYRISSWVVTINTFRELSFVRCIVLASYFLQNVWFSSYFKISPFLFYKMSFFYLIRIRSYDLK